MKPRIREISYLIIFLAGLTLFFNGRAYGEAIYQIKDIGVSEKDDSIEVTIGTTGEPQYKFFQLEDPPRLVIDLLNATSELIDKKIPVSKTSIQRVRSGQFRDEPVKIVRVVIDLKQPLDCRVTSRDNKVVASFSRERAASSQEEVPARPEVVSPPKNRETAEEIIERLKTTKTTPAAVTPPVTPTTVTPTFEEPTISLDLKDADLLDVLRLIGHKACVNIVPSKDVSGKVTLRLDNVRWDQALDAILKSQGYIYVQEGGLIRVGRREEFALEMTTVVIPLRYARASDVCSSLQSHRTYRTVQTGQTIGTDSRTNSLIITDTPKEIAEMREIIKKLDVRTRQVLIEARIVDVSKTGLKSLGITWSVDDAKDSAEYTKTSQPFGATTGEAAAGTRYVDEYIRGQVNYGAVPGAGGFFSFGFLAGDFNVDMALSALESKGEANILSSPSVLAMDNQQATITSGKSIPLLQTTTGTTGTQQTVVYKDVGITLIVTPKITPDDYITLTLNPRVEDVGEQTIQGYPIIITNSVTTDILVKDGDTIVIGGIIKEKEVRSFQKIPFLGDIPIVGRLFRNEISNTEEAELLVFIRTKIIRERE